MFGKSKDNDTIIIGEGDYIEKIIIIGAEDLTSQEVKGILFKFGEINEIKNSDIMESIISLKNELSFNQKK